MANRRMINKDDVDSPSFGELTVQQRYTFWAIMLNADDDGIIPVKLVSSKCFPYDKIDENTVMNDLRNLEKLGFISMYENETYLIVKDWWQRQFIDNKIYKPTKFKRPPDYEERPKNLKKYHHSRKYLEQSNKEKNKKEEIKKNQNQTNGIRNGIEIKTMPRTQPSDYS